MSTYYRLDLESLGSRSTMLKNFPATAPLYSARACYDCCHHASTCGMLSGNPARRQSVSDALDSVSVLKSMEFPEQCVMWDSSINLRHIQDIIAEHFRQYPEEGHDWITLSMKFFVATSIAVDIVPLFSRLVWAILIYVCWRRIYSHLWYHSGIWICHNFTSSTFERCCATVYLAPLDEQCYATALWIVLCHQHI